MEHMHLQGVVQKLHHVTRKQPHDVRQDLPGACQSGQTLFGVWRKNPEKNKEFLYHTFSGNGCDDCRLAVALRIAE
jgi:hypothetical protein